MSQNSIGSAALILSTNSQKLQDGIQQAEKKIEGLTNKVKESEKKTSNSFGKMFIPLLAGIAIIDRVSKTFERANEISKFSNAIGASVEELSRLDYAGRVAGIELSDLADGLKELTVKFNDFRDQDEIKLNASIDKIEPPKIPDLPTLEINAQIEKVTPPKIPDLPELKIPASIDVSKVPDIQIPELKIPASIDVSKVPELNKFIQIKADIDRSEIDELRNSMNSVQEKVKDIADASSLIENPFKSLNLSVRQLESMSLPDQIGEIADKLKEIKNPADKLAISMKLFGEESGVKFIEFLNLGQEGIKKLISESDRFGATLKSTDVNRLKEVQQGWTKLSTIFQSLVDRLIIDLSPALVKLGKTAISAFERMRPSINAVISAVGFLADALASTIQKLNDVGDFLGLQHGPAIPMEEEKRRKETFEKYQKAKFQRVIITYEMAMKDHDFIVELDKGINAFNIKLDFLLRKVEAKLPPIKVPLVIEKPDLELDKIKKQLESPVERFRAELAKLNEYEGRQMITVEDYFRSVNFAAQELLSTLKQMENVKAPELLIRGSREALQFEMQNKLNLTAPKQTNRLEQAIIQSRDLHKIQVEQGRELIKSINRDRNIFEVR